MVTNINPIVALWLVPVVLQIALPLAMLAGWSVVKVIQNVLKSKQINEEVRIDNLQAAPSM